MSGSELFQGDTNKKRCATTF